MHLVLFLQMALIQATSATDLLTSKENLVIRTPEAWQQKRSDLLNLVTDRFYGSMPPKTDPQAIEIKHVSSRSILNGTAEETLSIMILRRGDRQTTVRFGVVRPLLEERVPIIIKNDRWIFDLSAMPPGRKYDQYANEQRDDEFLKIRTAALSRGYAICKFVREDVAVDASNSRETGVLDLYPEYDWGAVTAWAWFYQPLIDYLQSTGYFDDQRIIATGHSRGGKTALAAAIFDDRIAIAAPSASGSGGTGSWFHFTPGGREQTPTVIQTNHGFWFGKGFEAYLPDPGFDGHTLHALVAPHGLINTQGSDDPLANPRGTRKMFEESSLVFDLLDARLPPSTHWRAGGHGHLLEDWIAVMDYADAYFAQTSIPSQFNNWPAASKDD